MGSIIGVDGKRYPADSVPPLTKEDVVSREVRAFGRKNEGSVLRVVGGKVKWVPSNAVPVDTSGFSNLTGTTLQDVLAQLNGLLAAAGGGGGGGGGGAETPSPVVSVFNFDHSGQGEITLDPSSANAPIAITNNRLTLGPAGKYRVRLEANIETIDGSNNESDDFHLSLNVAFTNDDVNGAPQINTHIREVGAGFYLYLYSFEVTEAQAYSQYQFYFTNNPPGRTFGTLTVEAFYAGEPVDLFVANPAGVINFAPNGSFSPNSAAPPGLFAYLGAAKDTEPFQNPVNRGTVIATGSSVHPEVPFAIADNLSDRRPDTYAATDESGPGIYTWELLDNVDFLPESYAFQLRQDYAVHAPSGWVLEGSADGGNTWIELDSRPNTVIVTVDQDAARRGTWEGPFSVASPQRVSMLRLRETQLNSAGFWTYQMADVEFYGTAYS